MGREAIPEIARSHAARRGIPEELALRYLTRHIHFELGDDDLAAIRRFHALASRHGILDVAPDIRLVREDEGLTVSAIGDSP